MLECVQRLRRREACPKRRMVPIRSRCYHPRYRYVQARNRPRRGPPRPSHRSWHRCPHRSRVVFTPPGSSQPRGSPPSRASSRSARHPRIHPPSNLCNRGRALDLPRFPPSPGQPLARHASARYRAPRPRHPHAPTPTIGPAIDGHPERSTQCEVDGPAFASSDCCHPERSRSKSDAAEEPLTLSS
jgi:hypothetical protein